MLLGFTTFNRAELSGLGAREALQNGYQGTSRLPDCGEDFNTGVTGVTEATLVSIGSSRSQLAMRSMPSRKRATWKLMRSPVGILLERRYAVKIWPVTCSFFT